MMRRPALLMLALAAVSCGDDSSLPTRPDAATDGSVGPDARSSDGATDGSSPGACGQPCTPTQFCELPTCNASSGGSCVLRPTGICNTLAMPQCGCDGITYSNECQRRSAGVSKLKDGFCTCTKTPPAMCCYENNHCTRPGSRCSPNADCVNDMAGVCVPAALAGTCWLDSDCQAPRVCKGARICPCMASCLLPDAPGTCGDP